MGILAIQHASLSCRKPFAAALAASAAMPLTGRSRGCEPRGVVAFLFVVDSLKCALNGAEVSRRQIAFITLSVVLRFA
jgi:hypothetical protein